LGTTPGYCDAELCYQGFDLHHQLPHVKIRDEGLGACEPKPLVFRTKISREELCAAPTHTCFVFNQWDAISAKSPSVLISALATTGVIMSAHYVTSLVHRDSNALEFTVKLSMQKVNTG
jgi:hypothetical protein